MLVTPARTASQSAPYAQRARTRTRWAAGRVRPARTARNQHNPARRRQHVRTAAQARTPRTLAEPAASSAQRTRSLKPAVPPPPPVDATQDGNLQPASAKPALLARTRATACLAASRVPATRTAPARTASHVCRAPPTHSTIWPDRRARAGPATNATRRTRPPGRRGASARRASKERTEHRAPTASVGRVQRTCTTPTTPSTQPPAHSSS